MVRDDQLHILVEGLLADLLMCTYTHIHPTCLISSRFPPARLPIFNLPRPAHPGSAPAIPPVAHNFSPPLCANCTHERFRYKRLDRAGRTFCLCPSVILASRWRMRKSSGRFRKSCGRLPSAEGLNKGQVVCSVDSFRALPPAFPFQLQPCPLSYYTPN